MYYNCMRDKLGTKICWPKEKKSKYGRLLSLCCPHPSFSMFFAPLLSLHLLSMLLSLVCPPHRFLDDFCPSFVPRIGSSMIFVPRLSLASFLQCFCPSNKKNHV